MPSTFKVFNTAFKDQYLPLDNAYGTHDKLGTVSKKGGMLDYCAEFDTIVLSLLKSHPKDLVHAFIYELKPNLRLLVKS